MRLAGIEAAKVAPAATASTTASTKSAATKTTAPAETSKETSRAGILAAILIAVLLKLVAELIHVDAGHRADLPCLATDGNRFAAKVAVGGYSGQFRAA